MCLAQKTAGLAVGQVATATAHELGKHHERRQIGPPSPKVGHHRTDVRGVDAAGEPSTGLHHLPSGVVNRRTVVMAGPDQGEPVRDPGVAGQEFGNLKRIRLGPNGAERSPDLARRIGFHVPEINVTGTAEVENHDAGPAVCAGRDPSLRTCSKILRQRQADGRERSDLEELASAGAGSTQAWSILRGFCEEIEHGRILPRSTGKTPSEKWASPGLQFRPGNRRAFAHRKCPRHPKNMSGSPLHFNRGRPLSPTIHRSRMKSSVCFPFHPAESARCRSRG